MDGVFVYKQFHRPMPKSVFEQKLMHVDHGFGKDVLEFPSADIKIDAAMGIGAGVMVF